MEIVEIAESKAELSVGDFQARIEGDILMLPQRLMASLTQLHVRPYVPYLVGYLNKYPRAIAISLSWNDSDLLLARNKLFEQLKGYVDGDVLSQKPGTELPPDFRTKK